MKQEHNTNTQIFWDLTSINMVLDFINSEHEVAINNSNRKQAKAFEKLYSRLLKVYQRTHNKAFPATEV